MTHTQRRPRPARSRVDYKTVTFDAAKAQIEADFPPGPIRDARVDALDWLAGADTVIRQLFVSHCSLPQLVWGQGSAVRHGGGHPVTPRPATARGRLVTDAAQPLAQ